VLKNAVPESYFKLLFESHTEFCAGSRNKDACVGDIGGPLICVDTHEPVLYGLVSTPACGIRQSIFANVSSVIDWMESVISEEDPVELLTNINIKMKRYLKKYFSTGFARKIEGTALRSAKSMEKFYTRNLNRCKYSPKKMPKIRY